MTDEKQKEMVVDSDEKLNNDVDEHGTDDVSHDYEIDHDDLDDAQDHSIDEDELNKLELEGLFEKAQACLLLSPREALNQLSVIRGIFFDKYQEAKNDALEQLSDEEKEGFRFEKADLAEGIDEILATAKSAIAEEKQRIEDEKQKNYKAKLKLLQNLKDLVAEDETEQSIERVKEIQREWRSIRVLPKDKVQELWDEYHKLLDTFYDNHSINIELKDLDRRKNLEAKIELTKKVEALSDERSLKRSFILLNKYHEEFKNIGPIPQESREAIWSAFKAASDEIYKVKRAEHDANTAKREENYKKKALLVEKAELVAGIKYDSMKDWNAKTKEMDALFDEWRKIGPVPRAKNDSVWSAFKEQRATFFGNRKSYFNSLNKERNANLKLKEALCEKVEALKDSEDLVNTTKEIIAIQKEWKKIGPVPDKVNQAVWGRFRKACDHFFNRKEKAFEGQRKEELENLKTKKSLIEELKGLLSKDADAKTVFEELKRISASWNKAGFIPKKELKKVHGEYDKLSDELFKKYKKDREDLKEEQWEGHYREILNAPAGDKRLKDEEYRLKKRMRHLKDELLQMEQNMSFFSVSKGSNILKDFEKKSERSAEQIDRLKRELKVISKVKREASKAGE